MPLNSWLQTGKYQSFVRRQNKSILVKRFESYTPAKLVIKNKMRLFVFEATFFVSLFSESLLSERPWFESRRGQTLSTHSFVAPE